MLFRPPLDQNLAAIHAMLDSWNVEADHFRQAARAATNGEAPALLTTCAAHEMKDAIEALLAEIDDALQAVAPCTRSFMDLMHAQLTALALLESVDRSCEMLEVLAPVPVNSPTLIPHEVRLAAE
jgi:hypothetical protein